MHFTKWHGCGNDYVFVNGFKKILMTHIVKSSLSVTATSAWDLMA